MARRGSLCARCCVRKIMNPRVGCHVSIVFPFPRAPDDPLPPFTMLMAVRHGAAVLAGQHCTGGRGRGAETHPKQHPMPSQPRFVAQLTLTSGRQRGVRTHTTKRTGGISKRAPWLLPTKPTPRNQRALVSWREFRPTPRNSRHETHATKPTPRN